MQDEVVSGIKLLILQCRALVLCCWSVYFIEDKEPVCPTEISGFFPSTPQADKCSSPDLAKLFRMCFNIKAAIPHIKVLQPLLTQQGNCYPVAPYRKPQQKATL